MINHRLFVKGEEIYALLTSHSHPNVLIPVKAVVKDVKYDDVNPLYQIKAVKFYDDIRFLKKYLFDMSFQNVFDKRARKFSLDPNSLTTRKQLEEKLSGKNESKYYSA